MTRCCWFCYYIEGTEASFKLGHLNLAHIEGTEASFKLGDLNLAPNTISNHLKQRTYIVYSKPLSEYNDVVTSAELSRETLEKLHTAMATKFMVPIIGGKELDLHRLFVEDTS